MRTLRMDTFNPKSRRMMHGLTVLYIIFVLFIAGIGAPRKNKNTVVPQMLQPIENLFENDEPAYENLWFQINNNEITGYFTNEKNEVFGRVETIYRITEQSSTSSSRTTNKRKDILALAHVTYLAFWTAIDFRIGYLTFSIFEHDYEANICSLYFNEMYFAFYEFREKLLNMASPLRNNIRGNNEDEVIKQMQNLTLDFISDKETLDNKEPDNLPEGLIVRWPDWLAPTMDNGKSYKTIFVSTDYVRNNYIEENMSIDTLNRRLYSEARVKTSITIRENCMRFFTHQLLKGIRYFDDAFWIIFYKIEFSVKKRMWLMLANEFTIDPETEKVHRISNAIEIMKKIRHMHFTVMYNTFEHFRDE